MGGGGVGLQGEIIGSKFKGLLQKINYKGLSVRDCQVGVNSA